MFLRRARESPEILWGFALFTDGMTTVQPWSCSAAKQMVAQIEARTAGSSDGPFFHSLNDPFMCRPLTPQGTRSQSGPMLSRPSPSASARIGNQAVARASRVRARRAATYSEPLPRRARCIKADSHASLI